jgi:hypothetical protein
VRQTLEDLGGRKDIRASGREFDRKWEVVETARRVRKLGRRDFQGNPEPVASAIPNYRERMRFMQRPAGGAQSSLSCEVCGEVGLELLEVKPWIPAMHPNERTD